MNEIDSPPVNAVETKEGEIEMAPLVLEEKSKSLTLSVEGDSFESMPEQIDVGGTVLDRKQEFHVTAIGFARGREIKKAIEDTPDLEQQLNAIIAELDFDTMDLLPEKYHISQDKEITRQLSKKEKKQMVAEGREPVDTITEVVHREAVIQMAEVPAVSKLYERCRELGIDLGEAPPVHITLYTGGDGGAIGINTEADFQALNPQAVEIN